MDDAKVSRNKYWSEVDTEEKCKRLREETKRMQRKFDMVMSSLSQLLSHEHGKKGNLLVGLNSTHGEDQPRRTTGEDVYF